jgi:hypothetical protein
MRRAWMTYAWKDNLGPNAEDVDFLVQEIEGHGVKIRKDTRDIIVGQPLWPQIAKHIVGADACDALVFVVTPASLASAACREELLYALKQTLDAKGGPFPLIGLVHGTASSDLPAALSVRLWVSTDDPNWAARVASGVRGEAAATDPKIIQPFAYHFCDTALGGGDRVLEVHPRVGAWAPFCFGLPEGDAHRYKGGPYAPPGCVAMHQSGSMCSSLTNWMEGGWWWQGITSPAISATMGAHLFLHLGGRELTVKFGQRDGALYQMTLKP